MNVFSNCLGQDATGLTFEASAISDEDAGQTVLFSRGDCWFEFVKSIPGTVLAKEDVDLGDDVIFLICVHFLHCFSGPVPKIEGLGTHDTVADRMVDFDPRV